jgi:penicillin-binding protein 1A
VADRSARDRRAPRNQAGARSSGRASTATATKKPWWKRWWVLLLVFPALLVAAVGLLIYFLVFSRVPLPDDIAATASIVYDRDGEEVGGLAAEVARDDVTLAELPDHVPQAVMGVEDRNFYEHGGISTTGIARALFTNVRSGSVQQGGSTITQQYIKNAAVGAEQTYARKVQEAALAVKLEREYSKDQILEFYLNTIYWGRGAYGIQAAARTYFDVDASELSLNQSATLAGMIASPSNLDPAEAPERVDGRRQVALTGMLEQDWIDQTEHDAAVAEGVPDVTERTGVELGPNAYYLDAVRRELSRVDEFDEGELFRGLRIYTQLSPRLQRIAQSVLASAVAEGPTDTGSIVTVDPRTGGVLALVGGPDIDTQQLNAAVVSPRQPGSTFKAFTLQAFTEAEYSPESTLPAPAELEVDTEGGDDYTVNNYGGNAYGEQTVYQATMTSTNTVYFQMQEEAGRERVIDAASRAGLPVSKSDERFRTQRGDDQTMQPNPSLTLGVDGFTPLEMASAFGTYAAEGLHIDAHLVVRIENAEGSVLWEPSLEEDQSVEVNVARVVTEGLRQVVESGTGQAAQIGRPAAGKTGTTQESKDAWFVGYVPQLATSVWLGNLDNTSIEGDATGGGLAAPVWGEYMAQAVEGMDVEDFVRPDLSDLEVLNEEPATCPPGYRFADPPSEADEDGFFPDILTDITDDQGRPCVEEAPEPEEEEQPECPEGYAFADSPPGDADPMPNVISDITDEDGRPCVEVAPEPQETEEPEEPEEPEEEEPIVDLPGDGDEEEPPADGEAEGAGSGDGDGDGNRGRPDSGGSGGGGGGDDG